jgi:hypothetical protein
MSAPESPDVQWAQGYASGARSWAAHGVGRVHRRDPERQWMTLCGRCIPAPSRLLYPSAREVEEERCKLCAARMAKP